MKSTSTLLLAALSLAVLHCPAADTPVPMTATPQPEILTPAVPATPRITGPTVFGVRPTHPFFYAIPATGTRPMQFSVDALPAGLEVDAATGVITGRLTASGEYRVTFRATNRLGSAEKHFTITAGESISLTPPMGWNSWNCWGGAVSQEKVLSSARAMVARGLQQHGWSYINIDDGWQGRRGGGHGAIQPNAKFPDLKRLADEIHSLGLRFGLYSSPWRGTYAGHIGSSADRADGRYDWQETSAHNADDRIGRNEAEWDRPRRDHWRDGAHSFVPNDVRQWVDWGIDYLKYDWYPIDVRSLEAIRQPLRASGRDVVLSLSNNAHFDQAADWARLANAWRTTQDIGDAWARVCEIGFAQDRWAAFNGPGHWNDPDMLVLGRVGWGPNLHPTHLTPNEQYSHFTLWCLLSAPLLLGCDLAALDEFTLSLLTNDEVLALDQDPLGRQATQMFNDGTRVVYAKTMADGSMALGLFNLGETPTTVTARWYQMPTPLAGTYRVRDLWRQKDTGTFTGAYESTVAAEVAPHGVMLYQLIPVRHP